MNLLPCWPDVSQEHWVTLSIVAYKHMTKYNHKQPNKASGVEVLIESFFTQFLHITASSKL